MKMKKKEVRDPVSVWYLFSTFCLGFRQLCHLQGEVSNSYFVTGRLIVQIWR